MKVRSQFGAVALSLLVSASLLGGCSLLGKGGADKKPKTPTVGNRIPILSSEASVEAEPALADVAVLLPPANANRDWGQPGGNGAKAMEHVALGNSLGVAWTASIAGSSKRARLAAAPVVEEGRLFVTDTNANLVAFNAKTGARLWQASLAVAGEAGKAVWGGGVSVENGIVYATNGMGDVAALEAATGKQKWKVRPSGPLRGAPTVGNGNVYVMTNDNQIFALSAANGSVEWSEAGATELAGVFGVAAPSIGQATVVAGFSSGELNAYRYENGRVLWNDSLARTSISTSVSSLTDIDASPVIYNGRVFAVGKGGRMVSVDLATGQRLWEINAAGIATPWVAGEWVFVVTDDARLLCVSRGSGKVRWVSQLTRYQKAKKKAGPINWVGPIVAGDRLILANSQGQLVNINPANGQIQTTTKIGNPVFQPPIVADGMLYVLDDSGRITAWR